MSMCDTCKKIDAIIEEAVEKMVPVLNEVKHTGEGDDPTLGAATPHPKNGISLLEMNLIEAAVKRCLKNGAHPVTVVQMAADMVGRAIADAGLGSLSTMVLGGGEKDDEDFDGIPTPVNKLPC